MPSTYRDVIMSRWGQGRIGVIGDAAHAMSPQLGQGANMAFLDSAAIANATQACSDWDTVLARELSMPLLYRLPWLRDQMAETVAGRKQGWL